MDRRSARGWRTRDVGAVHAARRCPLRSGGRAARDEWGHRSVFRRCAGVHEKCRRTRSRSCGSWGRSGKSRRQASSCMIAVYPECRACAGVEDHLIDAVAAIGQPAGPPAAARDDRSATAAAHSSSLWASSSAYGSQHTDAPTAARRHARSRRAGGLGGATQAFEAVMLEDARVVDVAGRAA
jgi:hypothetical protein